MAKAYFPARLGPRKETKGPPSSSSSPFRPRTSGSRIEKSSSIPKFMGREPLSKHTPPIFTTHSSPLTASAEEDAALKAQLVDFECHAISCTHQHRARVDIQGKCPSCYLEMVTLAFRKTIAHITADGPHPDPDPDPDASAALKGYDRKHRRDVKPGWRNYRAALLRFAAYVEQWAAAERKRSEPRDAPGGAQKALDEYRALQADACMGIVQSRAAAASRKRAREMEDEVAEEWGDAPKIQQDAAGEEMEETETQTETARKRKRVCVRGVSFYPHVFVRAEADVDVLRKMASSADGRPAQDVRPPNEGPYRSSSEFRRKKDRAKVQRTWSVGDDALVVDTSWKAVGRQRGPENCWRLVEWVMRREVEEAEEQDAGKLLDAALARKTFPSAAVARMHMSA